MKHKFQKIIPLYNRYRDKLWLEFEEDSYVLNSEQPIEHMGVSFELNKKIISIDPSGGPFLMVGNYIPNTKYRILSIESSDNKFKLKVVYEHKNI